MKKVRFLRFSYLVVCIAPLLLLLGWDGHVSAAPVAIVNPGFESFVLADGKFTRNFVKGNPDEVVTADPIPGWSLTPASNSGAGTFNPSAASFPNEAPEGQNVAYSGGHTISQVLSEVLVADKIYTLQVEVGNRQEQPFPDYRIQLLAGGVVLAEDNERVFPADGTFTTATLVFVPPTNHPLLGQNLEIRLLSEDSKTSGEQVNFDDVRLDVSPRQRDVLHLFGNATDDAFSGIGPNPNLGPAFNFGYSGFSFGRSSGFFNVRPDALAPAPNPSLRFLTQNLQRMIIDRNGNVGIGNFGAALGNPGASPLDRLHVKGNIRVEGGSFIDDGTTLNVPDYVFTPDYQLMPLKQLAAYIEREKHLPNMPSLRDIKANGLKLGEMQMHLLKKVEELTLYTLQQEEMIRQQEQALSTQTSMIVQLQHTNQEQLEALATLVARIEALERAQAVK